MDEGGKTTRSDIWGGVGWVSFGLVILVEALRMDRFTSMGATIYTMPGFVPGMIGVVVMVLGTVLTLRGWRRLKDATSPDGPPEPILNGRIAITILLTLVYAGGLIGRVPFWLATALFVGAFTWLFAPTDQAVQRRLIGCILAGVLTSAVVSIVFQEVFLVRLP
jgi:Tripartite tricarboxylate transporter TctB family